MTIDKAIEILSDHAYKGVVTLNQDFKDAEKLGIEALKAMRNARSLVSRSSYQLLPGETE